MFSLFIASKVILLWIFLITCHVNTCIQYVFKVVWILRWNFSCWVMRSFWHIVGNWTIFCILQVTTSTMYIPKTIGFRNSNSLSICGILHSLCTKCHSFIQLSFLSFCGISRSLGRFKWTYIWHEFMILMMLRQHFSHSCVFVIFLWINLYLVDYNFYTLVGIETTVLHSSKRKHVNIQIAYSRRWTTLPSNHTDARCWMPFSYWMLRQM